MMRLTHFAVFAVSFVLDFLAACLWRARIKDQIVLAAVLSGVCHAISMGSVLLVMGDPAFIVSSAIRRSAGPAAAMSLHIRSSRQDD